MHFAHAKREPDINGPGVTAPVLWAIVESFIGDLWPNGDPAALRGSAAAWTGVATRLHGVRVDTASSYASIGAQQIPEREPMQTSVTEIGNAMSAIADNCQTVAQELTGFAGEVANTQQAVRNLLQQLTSIVKSFASGGLLGAFVELFDDDDEQHFHRIVEDIKAVLANFDRQTEARRQLIAEAVEGLKIFTRGIQVMVERELVEYLGDDAGGDLAALFGFSSDTSLGVLLGGVDMVQSLGDMVRDPAATLQGLAGTAGMMGKLALYTNPLTGQIASALDPQGRAESVGEGVQLAKDMVHWDEIVGADRPGIGVGKLGFDIGAAVAGGGAAAKGPGIFKKLEGDGQRDNPHQNTPSGKTGSGDLDDAGDLASDATERLDEIAQEPSVASPPPQALPSAGRADSPASVPQPGVASAAPTHTPYTAGPTEQRPSASQPTTVDPHSATGRSTVDPPAIVSPSTTSGQPLPPGPVGGAPSSAGGLSKPPDLGAGTVSPGSIASSPSGHGSFAPDDVGSQDGPQRNAHDSGVPSNSPSEGGGTDGRDDGDWSNDNGSYLTPQQNALANEFLDHARQAEPRITATMARIADSTPGSELVGLEYRLKTEDSFKEKLAGEIIDHPRRSMTDHLLDMKDSVRYTMQSTEGSYAQNVTSAIDSLVADGYEPVKLKNSWGEPGYQGINSFWRDPATGHVFEVQFHTPESFHAKMITHPYYEEERLPHTTPERVAELRRMQNEIFEAVARPVGSSDVGLPPRRGG